MVTSGVVAGIVYVVHRLWYRLLGPLASRVPAPILIWLFVGFSASDWLGEAFGGQQITIVVVLTLMTASMFVLQAFEEIARSVAKAVLPAVTLGRIAVTMIYVVVSYSVMYTAIHYLAPSSFSGIPVDISPLHSFLYFAYFATLTFATVSFGDVVPQTLMAKWLVLSEVLFALVFVLFILSNISMFQATFHKFSPFAVSREGPSNTSGDSSEAADGGTPSPDSRAEV